MLLYIPDFSQLLTLTLVSRQATLRAAKWQPESYRRLAGLRCMYFQAHFLPLQLPSVSLLPFRNTSIARSGVREVSGRARSQRDKAENF